MLHINRYVEYTTGGYPYRYNTPEIQAASDKVARSRRIHVKNAMKHAWNGYASRAFGSDEIRPISGTPSDNWGGQGITLVDALEMVTYEHGDTIVKQGDKGEHFFVVKDTTRFSWSLSIL